MASSAERARSARTQAPGYHEGIEKRLPGRGTMASSPCRARDPRSIPMRDPVPARRTTRSSSDGQSGSAARRTRTLKVRLSEGEYRAVRDRARGHPSLASFARRMLTAGWFVPVERVRRASEAFLPIQEVIGLAEEAGHRAEAARATDALRRILAAVAGR